ncbi:MAG TPA: hypothetical protein VMN60_13795 [Longimicrobiales bacterium]|nr:hypothetical protein [Longimicrobiales bacterium]
MRGLGWLAAVAGLAWMLLSIFMVTTVDNAIGELHNLSRAHAQQLHFLAGAVLLLAGLLLVAIGYLRREEVSQPSSAPAALDTAAPADTSHPSDRVMCPLCYRFNDPAAIRCRCGKPLQARQPA